MISALGANASCNVLFCLRPLLFFPLVCQQFFQAQDLQGLRVELAFYRAQSDPFAI